MISSAWHLLTTAFGLAITQMGTSVLGFSVAIVLFLISFFVVFLKNGVSVMREHWRRKAGISSILLIAIWGAVVIFHIVKLIYEDHIEQHNRVQSLAAALDSTNDLFNDAAIEWDGRGNVIFTMTALRSGDDLQVYLDIRQGGGVVPFGSFLLEGQLAKQPRVEIGTIPHFLRGQILKVTLATVLRADGNQTIFQWGDKGYQNYKVGVNYSGYLGRVVVTEKNNPKEYHSYFLVVGRSFFDDKSNSTVVGPALIIEPNVLGEVKNWGAI
jgi:hypothetical protein